MKNLEEKKLLVKMARMLGEPVDPELLESIKKEEQLMEAMFGIKPQAPVITEVVEEVPVIEEIVEEPVEQIDEFVSAAVPPQEEQPAETGVQHLNVPDPEEGSKVAQTAKYLDKLQKMPPSQFKDAEMEAIRKTVAELLNRVNTLSWGGGGSGAVRFDNLDDHHFPKDIDYLQFNEVQTDPSIAANAQVGTMWWNSTEECLNIKQNQTTLQVGLEHYILFRNLTGNTITQGQVVYMSGTDGDGNPSVTLAIADTTIDPYKVLGIVTEDVANNVLGRATKFGKVRDLNTTGTPVSETWTTGTQLYLSDKTAGTLTNDHPTAPNVAIQLGHAMTIGTANGIILADVEATPRKYYGSFLDTTTQTCATSNTATAVKYNTTDFASGHVVVNYSGGTNNAIRSLNHGLFNYQFSCQFTSSSAARARIWIWIRKNGTDIANTATVVAIESNGGVTAPAWNFLMSTQPNDVFQLMWATDAADKVSMIYAANTAFCPAIPSVILTVTQVAE